MKKNTLKTVLICLATALLTAALIFCGLYIRLGRDGVAMLSKIAEIKTLVGSRYVGEADTEAMADSVAGAMISALDDRWSYYMNSDEYQDYLEYSSNSMTGIGVTVQQLEEGGLKIIEVSGGSPADRAGVEPGQFIISIAGQDTRVMGTSELRDMIRAQSGEFELGLLCADGSEKTVTLSAELIYTSPVSFEMLENDIGYIRISNFEKGAAAESEEAIEQLLAQGAVSLIFDVRSNPGGYLSELTELLDYILPEGEIFVSVSADGEEEIRYSDAESIGCPLAVLINADSYSAAEFFAAALSEYDRAELIGQASTGKSRSQQTFRLSDGSAIHISTRNYLTPSRVDLARQGGLTPDIAVEQTGEGDAQLEAAVKYLS